MVSNSVMNAVLTLDTYNRGYDPKVRIDPTRSKGYEIGRYVNDYVSIEKEYVDIGFSANVYRLGSDIKIAYRGTDFNNPGFMAQIGTAIVNGSIMAFGARYNVDVDDWLYDRTGMGFDRSDKDVVNGYPIGAGFLFVPQSAAALAIYNRYSGDDWIDANVPGNVTLLGQSLGGGLAGAVSYLTGAKAVIYENMTFRTAVENAFPILYALGKYDADTILLRMQQSASIQAYGLGYEVLASLRLLMAPTELTSNPYHVLPNITGSFDPSNIHGQAMVVISMALHEMTRSSTWDTLAGYAFSHVGDADIVKSFVNTGGLGSMSDQLTSMIAYSVIDEGTRIFGDVGLKAFADDITDLENMFSSDTFDPLPMGVDLPTFIDGVLRMVMMFSAHVSYGRVLQSEHGQAVHGILTNEGTFLTLDFTADRWGSVVSPRDVPGFGGILDGVIAKNVAGDVSELNDLVMDAYGRGLTSAADVYSFGLSADGSAYHSDPVPSEGIRMIVGSDGSDRFYGHYAYDHGLKRYVHSNDIMIGGAGSDSLYGYGGTDVLSGGDGDDSLWGGVGDDTLFGGSGDDLLYAGGDAYAPLDQGGGRDHRETDTWIGGDGYDTLIFNAISFGYGVVVNMDEIDRSVVGIDGSGIRSTVTIGAGVAEIGALIGRMDGIESVFGTFRNDVFVGNGSSSFTGGYGEDVFYLKQGDTGFGGESDDVFFMDPGATAFGGSGADEFHFQLKDDWTSLTIAIQDLTSQDKVYLDWGGRSILLNQELPYASYYRPYAPFVVTREADGVKQMDDLGGAPRSVYYDGNDGGATIVTSNSPLFGTVYYQLWFGSGHDSAISKAIGSGYQDVLSVTTGLAGVTDLRSAMSSSMLESSDLRSFMSWRTGSVFGMAMTTSMVVASHIDAVGYPVGPISNGAAPPVFVLDGSMHGEGIFLYGPSGSYNQMYSTMDSGETLLGGSGNDLLMAGTGTGVHLLNAGAGDDVLYGRSGNDLMNGGDGEDVFIPGGGNDVINGGSGRDLLSYADAAGGIIVQATHGAGSARGSVGIDSFTGIEFIVGTQYPDVFRGGSPGMVLIGGAGNDQFLLEDGAVAVGGYGADVFTVNGSSALILDVTNDDEIYVDGIRVVGTRWDVSYERTDVGSDGSYDLFEIRTVTGSHMNGTETRRVGHWDGGSLTGVLMDEIVASSIQGSELLYVGASGAKLVIGDTTIFMSNWHDGAGGLTFEALGSRTGDFGAGGSTVSLTEHTTYSPYWWGTDYGAHMAMTETPVQIESLFGMI